MSSKHSPIALKIILLFFLFDIYAQKVEVLNVWDLKKGDYPAHRLKTIRSLGQVQLKYGETITIQFSTKEGQTYK